MMIIIDLGDFGFDSSVHLWKAFMNILFRRAHNCHINTQSSSRLKATHASSSKVLKTHTFTFSQ